MEIVNALGKPCPIPVIEAKKALGKLENGGVTVLVDNLISVQNLEKMARGFNCKFDYVKKDDIYEVIITLKEGTNPFTDENIKVEEISCFKNNELVVAIGRDMMGEGDEELGKILIKGFIYSLTELDLTPEYLIFFNSGVKLSTKGSNIVGDLKKLEEKGTQILSCGTCLNYYKLENFLEVGSITNMYNIVEKMSKANRLINM